MKTLPLSRLTRILLVLTLTVGAFSCKKDSDPTPGGNDGVVGSWELTAITIDPPLDGVSDLLALAKAFDTGNCISRSSFIFNNNGSMNVDSPAGCSEDVSPIEDEAKWKVTGNKIELTDSDGTETYDLDVNKTEMKWTVSETVDNVVHKSTIVFRRR